MLEEKNVEAERIEVLMDGTLQVRDATLVVRDGKQDTSFPPKYHRYVLHPGDSLDDKPDKVKAVAKAVWTKDVVAARKALDG